MKLVKISRFADGSWRVALRCTCGNDWTPHVARGVFGRTVAEAVRAFRAQRKGQG